jgi:hypothetical protein
METNGDGKSKSKNAKSEKINVKLNKSVINENEKGESKKVKSKDNSVAFVIVEKNGSLKDSDIKESLICAEELSKKCKFKKVDGFIKRTQWGYSSKNEKENVSSKITVELWAKDDGIANSENKYEFPPPVDSELFFGACALVARDGKNNYINLTKDKWNKIYEYLFGGFESLVANDDDDDEEDELESISKNKKTRDGYLKDGFVVDGGAAGDSDVDVAGNSDSDSEDDDDDDGSETDSEKSSENGDDDDGECDGETGVEGVYFKKNKNMLAKNVSTKMKLKNKNSISENEKHILKEEEDDNSGWKTDESSELSEEEYSYSK